MCGEGSTSCNERHTKLGVHHNVFLLSSVSVVVAGVFFNSYTNLLHRPRDHEFHIELMSHKHGVLNYSPLNTRPKRKFYPH